MEKVILCYGDSNTWGFVPTEDYTQPKARYPRTVRWPGKLQLLLGEKFHVIEEGLNSRTTNLDHTSPPDRNGKNYLGPCLYSHSPLDLVIIDLGGNDLKTYFNRTPEQITAGLAELVDIVKTSDYGHDMQSAPDVLIIGSAIPHAKVEECVDEEGVKFMAGSVAKAKALASLFESMAAEKSCHYLDLTHIGPSDIDGVHYDEKGHAMVADEVAMKVKTIL